MLDKIDKAILKLLIKYKNQTLSINQIAKKISSSSLTVKRHIKELEKSGYVYLKEDGKVREYDKRKKD